MPDLIYPKIALNSSLRNQHAWYEDVISKAKINPAIPVAVVHPCSLEALSAAVEAKDEGLIIPILIGPEYKIQETAKNAHISLEGIEILPVEHSHAAAALAVEIASQGKVAAIMKGSLHTDELLSAILAPNSTLLTDRRLSHAYVMDIPAYSKPLVITDAAINIAPTLEDKRDICQNAINLMHALGISKPLLAAIAAVETVNPKMPATLDAAALTIMSERGQIRGGIVDGPLGFDNAIDLNSAKIKGITSQVAGMADILLVPNLEAGNMLAKQLLYFANADAAGIVLGARMPIILTSRSDSIRVRLASVAVAKLLVENGKQIKK